jgi:hypothetical protein
MEGIPGPRVPLDVTCDRSAEWWETVALSGLRLRRALGEVLAENEANAGPVDYDPVDHPG